MTTNSLQLLQDDPRARVLRRERLLPPPPPLPPLKSFICADFPPQPPRCRRPPLAQDSFTHPAAFDYATRQACALQYQYKSHECKSNLRAAVAAPTQITSKPHNDLSNIFVKQRRRAFVIHTQIGNAAAVREGRRGGSSLTPLLCWLRGGGKGGVESGRPLARLK